MITWLIDRRFIGLMGYNINSPPAVAAPNQCSDSVHFTWAAHAGIDLLVIENSAFQQG